MQLPLCCQLPTTQKAQMLGRIHDMWVKAPAHPAVGRCCGAQLLYLLLALLGCLVDDLSRVALPQGVAVVPESLHTATRYVMR
jgi:hypothetical protein